MLTATQLSRKLLAESYDDDYYFSEDDYLSDHSDEEELEREIEVAKQDEVVRPNVLEYEVIIESSNILMRLDP